VTEPAADLRPIARGEAASTRPLDAQRDPAFHDFTLRPELLGALAELGFEIPTPIQAAAIGPGLAGRDVLGRAQTGTGKTAAFALPILNALDLAAGHVQALVLAPTRELALQVAEAIHDLAKHLGPVGVLPIYGGEPIGRQLMRLEGRVRVVVGTPGRVLDHLRRGSLRLDRVRFVVLDEADEMLRMGFLEDVEAILATAPAERQTSLFSATLPDEIAHVARRHLRDPVTIALQSSTRTVSTVEQRYVVVEPHARLEAIARLLETLDVGASLVFARTRAGCAELAELLESRGFASEAMHGDMAQSARQSVIRRLKNGQLRLVVATDVAARGLDVESIGLVINAELPDEPEVYVHRIGRTGRAGRSGLSILLLTPRQERRLRDLERFTGQRLTHMPLPSARDVWSARIGRFISAVDRTREEGPTAAFAPIVERLLAPKDGVDTDPKAVLAALACLAWGDRPQPSEPPSEPRREPPPERPRPPLPPLRPEGPHPPASERGGGGGGAPKGRPKRESQPVTDVHAPMPKTGPHKDAPRPPPADVPLPEGERATLSLGVGRRNGVRPGDIVGAIANEAGVPGQSIGAIVLNDNYSLVDVPTASVRAILERMKRSMICGRFLNIRVLEGGGLEPPPRSGRKAPGGGSRPPRR